MHVLPVLYAGVRHISCKDTTRRFHTPAAIRSVVRQYVVEPLLDEASPDAHQSERPLPDSVLDAKLICALKDMVRGHAAGGKHCRKRTAARASHRHPSQIISLGQILHSPKLPKEEYAGPRPAERCSLRLRHCSMVRTQSSTEDTRVLEVQTWLMIWLVVWQHECILFTYYFNMLCTRPNGKTTRSSCSARRLSTVAIDHGTTQTLTICGCTRICRWGYRCDFSVLELHNSPWALVRG